MSSCETIVDFELEPHEPQMVPQCLSNNLKGHVLIHVAKSKGIQESGSLDFIHDANILLKENGQIICENPSSLDVGNYICSGIELVEGAEYEMEVSHPNFNTIKAKQILPLMPDIESATYEKVGAYDPLRDNDYDRMKIVFNEPAVTEDYYLVQGFIKNKTGPDEKAYSLWTWTENPLLEETVNSVGLIFTDEAMNGDKVELDLKVDNTFIEPSEHDIYIKLSRITRDRFYYMRSMRSYEESTYVPLAEPVTIHSNFTNGYGIFALESANMYFIQ